MRFMGRCASSFRYFYDIKRTLYALAICSAEISQKFAANKKLHYLKYLE